MQYRKPPTWLPADLLEDAENGDPIAVEACALAKSLAGDLEDAGKLTAAYRPAFIKLCINWGIMTVSGRIMRKEGLTILTDRGTVRHPAAMTYKAAAQDVDRGFADFGLDPRSAATAKGNAQDAPDRPETSGAGQGVRLD